MPLIVNLFDEFERLHGRGGRRGRQTTAASEDEILALLTGAMTQVSKNLSDAMAENDEQTYDTICSYYTQKHPLVPLRLMLPQSEQPEQDEDDEEVPCEPFCVALAKTTMMFHMMLPKSGREAGDLWAKVITSVVPLIPSQERTTHPFMVAILHQSIFGLPIPEGTTVFHLDLEPHYIVKLGNSNYGAFKHCALSLIAVDKNAEEDDPMYRLLNPLKNLWHNHLSDFVDKQDRNIVGLRSYYLLLNSVDCDRDMKKAQLNELKETLDADHTTLSCEYLEVCYAKLMLIADEDLISHELNRGDRLIALQMTPLFLDFRWPLRRDYCERYLLPCLQADDMSVVLNNDEIRRKLLTTLLGLCTSTMTTTNIYYQCICAIVGREFSQPVVGALQVVEMMGCMMPHAGYVMGTMVIDKDVKNTALCNIILKLNLATAAIMQPNRHDLEDDVVSVTRLMQQKGADATSVYNVLFAYREMTRRSGSTNSARAKSMLRNLRSVLGVRAIETLGRYCTEAFVDILGDEGIIQPDLLCGEIGMVLHQIQLKEAIDTALDYFRTAGSVCIHCNRANNTALLCPINGLAHMANHNEVSRIVTTIAECAGHREVAQTLIHLLRSAPGDVSTHMTVFNILKRSGQHKQSLYNTIEPHFATMFSMVTAVHQHRSRGVLAHQVGQPVLSSLERANLWFFHTHIMCFCQLLAKDGTTAARCQALIQSMMLRMEELGAQGRTTFQNFASTHEALAVWYCANVLLRAGKHVAELGTGEMENQTVVNGAQLLEVLHKAHTHNAAMQKLTGVASYRLSEDFIMQTPLIFNKLFGEFGTIQVKAAVTGGEQSAHVLAPWGISTSPKSPYWRFILDQLKRSPPARTAMATAIAQSMGQKFRHAQGNPASLIGSTKKVEATAPIIFVMMASVLQQSARHSEYIFSIFQDMMEVPADYQTPGRLLMLSYTYQQLLLCFRQFTIVRRPPPQEIEDRTRGLIQVDPMVPIRVARRIVTIFKSHTKKQLSVISRMESVMGPGNRAFERLREKIGRMAAYCSSQEFPNVRPKGAAGEGDAPYDSSDAESLRRQGSHPSQNNDSLAYNNDPSGVADDTTLSSHHHQSDILQEDDDSGDAGGFDDYDNGDDFGGNDNDGPEDDDDDYPPPPSAGRPTAGVNSTTSATWTQQPQPQPPLGFQQQHDRTQDELQSESVEDESSEERPASSYAASSLGRNHQNQQQQQVGQPQYFTGPHIDPQVHQYGSVAWNQQHQGYFYRPEGGYPHEQYQQEYHQYQNHPHHQHPMQTPHDQRYAVDQTGGTLRTENTNDTMINSSQRSGGFPIGTDSSNNSVLNRTGGSDRDTVVSHFGINRSRLENDSEIPVPSPVRQVLRPSMQLPQHNASHLHEPTNQFMQQQPFVHGGGRGVSSTSATRDMATSPLHPMRNQGLQTTPNEVGSTSTSQGQGGTQGEDDDDSVHYRLKGGVKLTLGLSKKAQEFLRQGDARSGLKDLQKMKNAGKPKRHASEESSDVPSPIGRTKADIASRAIADAPRPQQHSKAFRLLQQQRNTHRAEMNDLLGDDDDDEEEQQEHHHYNRQTSGTSSRTRTTGPYHSSGSRNGGDVSARSSMSSGGFSRQERDSTTMDILMDNTELPEEAEDDAGEPLHYGTEQRMVMQPQQVVNMVPHQQPLQQLPQAPGAGRGALVPLQHVGALGNAQNVAVGNLMNRQKRNRDGQQQEQQQQGHFFGAENGPSLSLPLNHRPGVDQVAGFNRSLPSLQGQSQQGGGGAAVVAPGQQHQQQHLVEGVSRAATEMRVDSTPGASMQPLRPVGHDEDEMAANSSLEFF